ncbi:PREDICTED: uncharacterized protein LOC109170474 isoform X1 [Ipomoea nil]|uniref:uncharacterized protein LOC109170474 isoform X1 n=1 Tax=Ipomoea nil TaxID=35883 RepID=UPI0009008A8F|nr:PREDICTED: uncharacterized protein LOC109170474 isoform X1 [Ipomoea nil]
MVSSPNIPPANVTICLQCGDRGYTNALVFCVECLEFAVHRYCLDDIPDTLDEFVRWVCDDCKAKVPNQLIVHNSEKTNDGKVHGRVSSSLDQSCDAQAIVTIDTQAQPKKLNLEEKHNASFLVVEEDGQRQLSGSFNQHRVEPVGCNTQAQLAACHEPGLPVIDVIWEGCFKICNKDYDIFDGLVAHLSVKAHEKVYKEANSFPPMLKLEMLPKSVVWPKSFLTSEPTDENIALYFFPADTKCESKFDSLVEIMMREEVAMKAVFKNAELLIFTSEEVPLLYWRLKGKYYLWGVFRGRKLSSNSGTTSKCVDNTIGSFNQPRVGCNTQAQLAACHEPGLPVINIIWRGCFKICYKDYDILDGLAAHLPVRASEKVYKEAKSFPPMLQLEMLPVSVVWPESFDTSVPTDQNIDLYFFAAKKKCRSKFVSLVEMMMQERLAMKAVLENSELLIFTSVELPLIYWRFQGEFYLWGLFRDS